MPTPRGTLFAQGAQYWERLQRALDIKGSVPNAVDWSVQGGVQMLDLTDPAYLFLSRTTRWLVMNEVAGVAAQNSLFELVNPAGSNKIVQVLELFTNVTANSSVGVWIDAVTFPGTTIQTKVTWLDSRHGVTGLAAAPAASPRMGNAAVALNPFAPTTRAASTQFNDLYADRNLILTPGNRMAVQVVTVNIGLWVQCFWQERDALPQEL